MTQIVMFCPYCRRQFFAQGGIQQVRCPGCGAIINSPHPSASVPAADQRDNASMVLGILSLILWLIPIFALPLPICGFILSYTRNYKQGIILNAIGLGLSLLWTVICIAEEMD